MPARKKVPSTQPQYYTVTEVCTILNLSRGKVRDLALNEQLPVEKFGSASRIPIEKFQRWLELRSRQVCAENNVCY